MNGNKHKSKVNEALNMPDGVAKQSMQGKVLRKIFNGEIELPTKEIEEFAGVLLIELGTKQDVETITDYINEFIDGGYVRVESVVDEIEGGDDTPMYRLRVSESLIGKNDTKVKPVDFRFDMMRIKLDQTKIESMSDEEGAMVQMLFKESFGLGGMSCIDWLKMRLVKMGKNIDDIQGFVHQEIAKDYFIDDPKKGLCLTERGIRSVIQHLDSLSAITDFMDKKDKYLEPKTLPLGA